MWILDESKNNNIHGKSLICVSMALTRSDKISKQLKTVVAFAMLFLTLFLSCSIRNAIQTSFKLPVTKPQNQSKTVVSGFQTCQLYNELSEINRFDIKAPSLVFFVSLILAFSLLPAVVQLKTCHPKTAYFLPDVIPLFILYRKIVIWFFSLFFTYRK